MNKKLELVRDAIAAAGGGKIDVTISETVEFGVSAFRGEISEYNRSKTGGASARAIVDGEGLPRLGMSYSEKLDLASLGEAARQAKRNGAFMDGDVGNGICEESGNLSQEIGKDSGWLDEDGAKRFVLDLEAECKSLDKRVVNVPASSYGFGGSESAGATGLGLYRATKQSYGYAYAYVMVSDGQETETGFYVQVVRDPAILDRGLIARKAVERGVAMLGAKESKSGNVPCVLSNEQASDLIGAFLGNVDAESMQKGLSKLAGKVGGSIGSKEFTIIDDPKAPGFGKSEFDSEGEKSSAVTIFDAGTFKEPLYTIYSARRENRASNGRGFRGGIKGRPTASLINAFIPDGDRSLDALMAEARDGIYITSLEGLHAGLDEVSGDFSCAAKGFEIAGGKLGGPLRNFTVSGNFYELARALVARGNDRRTDLSSSFSSPSLLIESLAVSGR
jgi:PmbA protein